MTRALKSSPNLNWLLIELPLENRPAAAAEAGFRAVECSRPYQLPAAQWRSRLHDAGVDQVLINTPTGPTNSATEFGAACLPGARDEFGQMFAQALEYALAIDCPTINVMAGMPPVSVPAELVRDTYLENMAWAAGECETSDVGLVIEAINLTDRPGAFIQRQEQAAKIVETLGSDRVRLLFDIYHCQGAQGDVARTFQRLSPVVRHVQIADAPGRAEPGTGELNFTLLLDILRASDYSGWVGLEYSPAHLHRRRAELATCRPTKRNSNHSMKEKTT